MNTFNYPIPPRLFIKNGGNIIKSKVVLAEDVSSEIFTVIRRDESTLYLQDNNSAGKEIKTHLDMCWVLAEILCQ